MRLIAWFGRNGIAANLLMTVIIAWGLLTLPQTKQEVFPESDLDYVSVSVPYRGATPEEVEEAVCIRIEERIFGIEGIKRLQCSAAEGAGTVMAEVHTWSEVDDVLDDIKTEIDAIDTFPAETERPVVRRLQMKEQVINIAVTGDTDEHSLRHLGERVRDDILALPDVTDARLGNARPLEIAIEVSEADLERHSLVFDDVTRAVRLSSLDLPAGSLKTREGEILLRTKGQAYRRRDFEGIPLVSRRDGTRVTLGEVAEVIDGFEETDLITRFDGRPAVMVQVYRVGNESALAIANAVKTYIATSASRLPEGVVLTSWDDSSQVLRDRIDTLLRNGRAGLFLVLLVLALFLKLRLAFWVGIGVPIAVLGTLAVMPTFGVSINVLSLFAFLVVLGILVDDAIVIGENVHTHQERGGDPLEASIRGTQEVALPVTFGVLTTVVAFVPLLTLPGSMGKITWNIPVVVIAALVFSMVESKLILPSHLGHVKPAKSEGGRLSGGWKRVQDAFSRGLGWFISQRYHPLLVRAVEWRYQTAALGLSAIILTIGMTGGGWAHFVFFPTIEADNVIATLTMPQGTPVEVTRRAAERLATSAMALRKELDEEGAARSGSVFQHVMISVGNQPWASRRGPSQSTATAAQSHLAEVNIELAVAQERRISSEDIARRWREATPPIPSAVELAFNSSLFDAGAPISIELAGNDAGQLRRGADMIRDALAEYPGVFDITDTMRGGKKEIELQIKPSAEILGLSASDLARQVRQGFYGDEAQRIQRGRDDVRVMVRYPATERRSLHDLQNMRIRTADGAAVPFSAVAEADMGRGFSSLERADRKRIVTVSADLDQTKATANEVVGSLRANVLPQVLEANPGLTYSLQGEQKEQAEFYLYMGRAFGAALLGIYALLAIPLASYVQPLLIMSAIPFGMVGAIWGHMLVGYSVSFFSIIGIVAVAGVVVNDSLVLVDYANRARSRGLSALEAIEAAGQARFRAILLTSLTTFAGLTPLLLEKSVQAQFLIPLAISLAFGVLFSTSVTLLLVPAGYLILEDLRDWVGGLGRRSRPPRGTPDAAPTGLVGPAGAGAPVGPSSPEPPV